MDAESIANLYLSTEEENAAFSVTKEELIQYVQDVIELKYAEIATKKNP